MADTVKAIHLFDEELDSDISQFNPPHRLSQKSNEDGEVFSRFYDWETCNSPLTSAGYRVRAIPKDPNRHDTVAGYEIEANIPACLNGFNHLLVNGVYRAAEGAVELLRNYAASANRSADFLSRFSLEKTRLESLTLTFLYEADTPEDAREMQAAMRRHAEAVLNHVSRPRSKKGKRGPAPCYSVGPEHCYTLYIKQRDFKVSAYIKQHNIPGAFSVFPSPEVEQEVVEIAARTVRVEIQVFGVWLRENGLDKPATWSKNPAAYEKVFQLAVKVLRLDESLRIRRPPEDVIAKVPAEHQRILRDHLDGANIREHELVLDCAGTVDEVISAQNKRFSAFKCSILEATGVDISIPWEIQSTCVSAHLKDWLRFRGEFNRAEHLKEFFFSRASGLGNIKALHDAAENGLPEAIAAVRRQRSKTIGDQG